MTNPVFSAPGISSARRVLTQPFSLHRANHLSHYSLESSNPDDFLHDVFPRDATTTETSWREAKGPRPEANEYCYHCPFTDDAQRRGAQMVQTAVSRQGWDRTQHHHLVLRLYGRSPQPPPLFRRGLFACRT